jgi:hypothetical protein
VAVAVNTTAVVDARLMQRSRVLAHGRARGRATVVVALRLKRALPRGIYVVRAAVTAQGRTTTVGASLRVR